MTTGEATRGRGTEPRPPRRRGPGHHLRDLTGPTRTVVLAVLLAVVLAPLVGSVLLLGDGWQPVGDRAIIALRSHDVVDGTDRPDLGQPTTGEIYTGEPSYHPGPAEYWLLAPFVTLLGSRAGLAVGTAVLSAAALGTTLLLALRGGGRTLFSLVALGLALLVRALGVAHFADPMNSELVAVFLLPAALAAWLVVLGDLRCLPVLAVAATIAAQGHVSGATNVAPLVLVAAGSAAWRLRDRRRWRAARGPLLLAGVVLLVGWAPPLLHELGDGPSNVAALYRTGTADEPVVGPYDAGERLARGIGPVPLFIDGAGGSPHLEDQPLASVLVAGALLGGLVSFGVLHAWRRRRSPVVRFLVVTGVVVATGALTVARSLHVQESRADGMRVLWVAGLLVWVSLAWAAWTALAPERRRAWSDGLDRGLAAAAVAVLALALVTTSGRRPDRDGDLMPAATEVQDELVANVPRGAYRLRVEGTEALVTFAPAIVARLEDAGYRPYVDVGTFVRSYGAHRGFTDQAVAGTLVVRSTPAVDGTGGDLDLRGLGELAGEGAGAPPVTAPGPSDRLVAEATSGGIHLTVHLVTP